MGEIIMFPGKPGKSIKGEPIEDDSGLVSEGETGKIYFIADRRHGKHPPGFLGGLGQKFREVMRALSPKEQEDLAEILGEAGLGGTSGRREGRHKIREDMEDQWWEARMSRNLEEQTRIEMRIGGQFGVRRGGEIINRLRTVASIHEVQNQPKNP